MTESQHIRIKPHTKQLLEELKLLEDETYDSVISRILQTKFEEILELNQQTKEHLSQQMQKVYAGEVFSGNELLDRVRAKRGQKK